MAPPLVRRHEERHDAEGRHGESLQADGGGVRQVSESADLRLSPLEDYRVAPIPDLPRVAGKSASTQTRSSTLPRPVPEPIICLAPHSITSSVREESLRDGEVKGLVRCHGGAIVVLTLTTRFLVDASTEQRAS